jgi:rubrerythrin
MNAKKERKLFALALGRLLQKQSKIVDDYRGLAEMLEDVPVGLLLDWVVIEEEAHHTLLINIVHSLKQTAQKERGNGANGVEMERETMMCWIERLKAKEQKVAAVCRALKSQAGWETGDIVDAFLDAMIMDSEKHQRFLLAVEKAIDNIMMSRPQ